MISSPFHCRQETYAAADINPSSGRPLDVGQVLEESGASKKSAGFFHKGILQAFESDHRAGGRAPEVKVVANGHCHSKSAEISCRSCVEPEPTYLVLFHSLGELQARERCLAVLRRWRVSSCFVLVVNQPCSKFLPSRTGWDADSNVTRACVRACVTDRTRATARSGSTGGSGYTTSRSTARRSGRTSARRATRSSTTWSSSAAARPRRSRASYEGSCAGRWGWVFGGWERKDGWIIIRDSVRFTFTFVFWGRRRVEGSEYSIYGWDQSYSLMRRRL